MTGLILPPVNNPIAPWIIPSNRQINKWERKYDLPLIRKCAITEIAHDVTNDRTNATDSTVFTTTTGDDIICFFVRTAGTGTFTMADNVNGSYTRVSGTQPSGSIDDYWVFRRKGVTGGVTTVTLTCSDGVTTYFGSWLHLRGVDQTATEQTDTIKTLATTNHTSATTGISGTGLYISMGGPSAITNVTPGSGWTTDNTITSVAALLQRKIQTGVVEVGPWTTSASLDAYGVEVFFAEAAAPSSGLPFITTLGAKRI